MVVAQYDGPRVGTDEPGDHVEERGLACAVGAHEADDLTAPDIERHVVERDDATEVLPDSLHHQARAADRRFSGGPRGSPPTVSPMNTARTRSCRSSSSAGAPSKRTSPCSRKYARSAIRSARSIDWSTTTSVVPVARSSTRSATTFVDDRGREAEGELVDEEHGRDDQCHRKGEHLLLAAGKVAGRLGDPVGQHREPVERSRCRLTRGSVVAHPPTGEAQVLADGERGEHALAAWCLDHPERGDPFRPRG